VLEEEIEANPIYAARAEQFDRDGFFVVEQALTPHELAKTLVEIDEFEAGSEAFLRTRKDERLMIAEAGAITFTSCLPCKTGRSTFRQRHPL